MKNYNSVITFEYLNTKVTMYTYIHLIYRFMFEFDKPTVVGETGVSRYHEVASFITMHLNIEHHTFEHHAFKHHVFKHRTSCITMHSVITHV